MNAEDLLEAQRRLGLNEQSAVLQSYANKYNQVVRTSWRDSFIRYSLVFITHSLKNHRYRYRRRRINDETRTTTCESGARCRAARDQRCDDDSNHHHRHRRLVDRCLLVDRYVHAPPHDVVVASV
jgi:hypothetical protein